MRGPPKLKDMTPPRVFFARGKLSHHPSRHALSSSLLSLVFCIIRWDYYAVISHVSDGQAQSVSVLHVAVINYYRACSYS